MKKTIFAIALSSCLLMSGCSGVSQEEYDSMVSANSQLESEKQALEEKYNAASGEYDNLKEKYDDLSADTEKIKQDNDTLKQDNESLKKENESLNSRIQELENAQNSLSSDMESTPDIVESSVTDEQVSENAEFSKEYITAHNYGTLTTENGSLWYLSSETQNHFIAYIDDLGYELDEKSAFGIVSDAVILTTDYSVLHHNDYSVSTLVSVHEPNGTPVCAALLMYLSDSAESGKIYGTPLTYVGDYAYLNDTDATRYVQDMWVLD